jgi:hypothetical protein
MKEYLEILHISAGWTFLYAWIVGLGGCFLITVPVKTAVSVTGTVVGTAAKVVAAPIRLISDSIADDSDDVNEEANVTELN